jgi:hypothetical protein
MEWFVIVGQLVVGFFLGTLVLWFCSFSVKTPNANLKTAVIYNAIMTGLNAVLMGAGLLLFFTESGIALGAFIVSLILSLVVSFFLLIRLYAISFPAALWLVFAMWAVNEGVEKIMDLLL